MKTAKRESAERVRELLSRARLNQCEAARTIGVSERTMRRYVSLHEESAAECPPPVLSMLRMLAGVSMADALSQPRPLHPPSQAHSASPPRAGAAALRGRAGSRQPASRCR